MNPDWICPYCTGACFCSRCRRQEQLTTAQAYLISLNLHDVLYTPADSIKVFEPQYQRSQNAIDVFTKANFERIVRACDLTQTMQARLNGAPKFCELVRQGRSVPHFFLESSLSTSNHVNLIMNRNSQARETKAPKASKNGDESCLQDKETAKLKKRLHHEFKNMLADELAFCRSAQLKSYQFLNEIGRPSDEEQTESEGEEGVLLSDQELVDES